ncbi:MAG: AAA family ATPase [Desulfobacterales bacterium]|nr:AAA family ATPase [Desulfobacterales bacterium]
MISFPGYNIIEQLYESAKTLVYRAQREDDGQPVALKMLKKDYPSPEEISRFRWEYNTTRNLNTDGIIKIYSLEKYQNTLVMILEDFGGTSLAKLLPSQKPDLEKFFRIACQIAEILGRIHQQNVMHKDINPANIILNPRTDQIRLIDFGISTVLSRESLMTLNLNVLEGTLAYMSPEQTGRMNRGIDYRTDLYSLGVTFYEMLTYQLPFEGNDAMELVHCHIAKKPVPPHEVNPDIPIMLSRIILKLMTKTAEDRYQSTYGLKHDLEECRKQWNQTGEIKIFPAALHDISYQLRIPQKLYGRENEITDLMNVFDQAARGDSQMMLVSGYAGIGKSVLVNEIRKPVTQKRGYFISGKFDQFQRNIPYSAIIRALQVLLRQCITGTTDEIQAWKEKILKSVGPNGQVIIDVIPEVELIVGKQPQVADLEPTESQNRFNMVFQNFISVFARKEHPPVIFLDDLQWADSASLNLIRTLITDPDSHYLFLIGAFRDNEVDETHPLVTALDEIQKVKLLRNLVLKPLELSHMNHLICETLHHEAENCYSLAELIAVKTGGNPFFINEFLKTLFREHLLYISNNGEWQWNFEKIQEQRITDNVVELLAGHILELPLETQNILKWAACIGNEFELNILQVISEHSLGNIIKDLWKAIEEGLIISSEDFDRLYDLACHDPELLEKIDCGVVKFRHDRIQQAAYTLIPEHEKKEAHLKIGWLVLENIKQDELDNKIFDIVGQLNKGWDLIRDKDKKLRLAGLNSKAGKRAKKATAYSTAADHFTLTAELLTENAWRDQYDLMFETKIGLAEVLYLSGNFEAADALYAGLYERACSTLGKIRVYSVQMLQYHLQGRLEEALQVQRAGLALLGLEFPDTEPELQALLEKELQKVPRLLGDRQFADLINAPEMRDENSKAMTNILKVLWVTAYISGDKQTLMAWSSAKLTNLSLEYGNSELSSFAYANYGFLLAFVFGDTDTGYQCVKMSLDLSEKFDNLAIRCQVYCMFLNLVSHWKKPYKSSLEYYKKAYEYGMESGEFSYASYALTFLIYHSLLSGSSTLEELYEEAKKFELIIRKINPMCFSTYLKPVLLHIANLRGLTRDNSTLNTDDFDEEQHARLYADNPLTLCWMYSPRIEILYLYEYYDKALELADQAEHMAMTRPGQAAMPQIYFFTCLILAKCYDKADEENRQKYLETIEKFQGMMKTWADNCEANHLHKYLLVEAEKSRFLGKETDAAELYDQAIESATKHEFVNNAALANELAAKFWMGKGREKFATLYMTEAQYLYQQWGATAKVNDLDAKYPHLLTKTVQWQPPEDTAHFGKLTRTTTSKAGSSLDLGSVMKASQAISGEIQLAGLLEKMIKIMIENAGARKGFLLLEKNGHFMIEAEGEIGKEEVAVLKSVPLETGVAGKDLPPVPISIIHYVARTKESVVLDDASREERFDNDPYLTRNRPKSVLCEPVLHYGKLTGILYLENNTITSAFSQERLEVLRLLSSQAAISIENARLYASIENKVRERTRQLNETLEEVEEANRRIMSSIRYAERIQKSVLPKLDEVKTYLPNSFFIWMPRDVVGGDIFHADSFEDGFIVAAIDCTGHGVPGAFMTMIASSFMRRITRSLGCHDPAEILKQLNYIVRTSLQQDRKDTLSDDGLEAAVCFVSKPQKTGERQLTFAGARLPLIYIHNDEINVIKGDKQSIGYKRSDVNFNFTNHIISIRKGMSFYMHTDGFVDQLGGKTYKSFGRNRFRNLLKEAGREPFEKQGPILIQAFNEYKGENPVQDDVTVVGFGF